MEPDINILQYCVSELQNELKFSRISWSILFQYRSSSKLWMRIWKKNSFKSRRDIKALDSLCVCACVCICWHPSSAKGWMLTLIPLWHSLKIQVQIAGDRQPETFLCSAQATVQLASLKLWVKTSFQSRSSLWRGHNPLSVASTWETIDFSDQYIQWLIRALSNPFN